MKKFIYLWLDGYNRLDDFNQEKGYLFENIGFNLSSEFVVSHKKENNILKVNIDINKSFQQNFFSEKISDLKVIVGNNGTGKSTIIRILFDVLSNNGCTCKDPEKLFLLYVEDNKLYCCSSRGIKVDIDSLPDGYSKGIGKISFKNDIPIYYSSEFDSFFLDAYDYRNISTSAFYYRDRNCFTISKFPENEILSHLDRITCYHEMEQNRFLDLLLNIKKTFFEIIPLPQKIAMSPIFDSIESGINVLVNLVVLDYPSMSSLTEILPNSCFMDYTDEHDAADTRKEIIKNFLEDCYSWVSNDIDDLLRFSVMLNCIRHFSTKKINNLNYSIDWKCFKKNTTEVIQDFFKINLYKPIRLMGQCIEDIIKYTKKCARNERAIFFDLLSDNQSLNKVVKTFNKMYLIAPTLQFKFTRSLSSGEKEFIRLYSRLYDLMKIASRKKYHLNSIYLFVDEADLYLHPEWQRKWFNTFILLIEDIENRLKEIPRNGDKEDGQNLLNGDEELKVQLILATHSPFMLTDCLSENILRLQREKNADGRRFGKVFVDDNKESSPLAGNILDVLQTGFFLDGTMGTFIEKKINGLISRLKSGNISKEDRLLLDRIGDPILKSLLKRKVKL